MTKHTFHDTWFYFDDQVLTKKVSNFLAVGYFLNYYFLSQGLIDDTWTFRFFVQSIQLCRGTKKVLWTFFARALNTKSEVEIKLFELPISVS